MGKEAAAHAHIESSLEEPEGQDTEAIPSSDMMRHWAHDCQLVKQAEVLEDIYVVVTIKIDTRICTFLCTRIEHDESTCTNLIILLRLKGIIPSKATVDSIYTFKNYSWEPIEGSQAPLCSGDNLLLIINPFQPRRKISLNSSKPKPTKSPRQIRRRTSIHKNVIKAK